MPPALSHAVIGQLVGAARPTVSRAIKTLTADGLLTRTDDGCWRLEPASWAILGPPAPALV